MAMAGSGSNYFLLLQRNEGFSTCSGSTCKWGIYGFYMSADGWFAGQYTTVFSNSFPNGFPSIVWNGNSNTYLASYAKNDQISHYDGNVLHRS